METARPDVVVIDISLEGGQRDRPDQADQGARRLDSDAGVFDAPRFLVCRARLRAGALGYINKENTSGRILDAIRSVRNGEIYLSEDATRRLVQRTIGHPESPGLSLESLSDRELEVFRLLGEGQSTSEMAVQLHLSVHTVDTYRRRIRIKLDVRNAAELMRTATEWVLVEDKNRNEYERDVSELAGHRIVRGCGTCCLVVTRPPFYHVFEEMGEEAWDRLQRQRPDLVAELHADYRARQAGGGPFFGTPCVWFDARTLRCRHYDYRPLACQMFESRRGRLP